MITHSPRASAIAAGDLLAAVEQHDLGARRCPSGDHRAPVGADPGNVETRRRDGRRGLPMVAAMPLAPARPECADDGGGAGSCARAARRLAGLVTRSMTACSVSLPRHATARAIAMTSAPPPTSHKTVRDITLPTVRRPTAFGVATSLREMIPCHPGPERHRIDCKKKSPCPSPPPSPPTLLPSASFAAPASASTPPRATPPSGWARCWPARA